MQVVEILMNKRILLVVMTAAVVTTSTGCTPFRNFFFGRGAKCGMGPNIAAPFRQRTAVAPPVAPCNPCQNAYAAPATVTSACPCDPYSGTVVDEYGQPVYGGNWDPRSSADYQSNYMGYSDMGAQFDRDGARIIYEDPMPADARAVN